MVGFGLGTNNQVARLPKSHRKDEKPMTPIQAKLPEGSNVLDYGRLSRDEDKDLHSLTNQMDILRDYSIKNGYNIVGEYFDDNVSGMTFDRKGLDKMLDKIEEHSNIQAIIVKDLSRLGRHRIKTALLIEQLERKGVRILSVTEGIDTSNEDHDLEIAIKQMMNDFYAKDIQRKIRFGYRQKQKEGIVIVPPFGYFKDKNTGKIRVVEEAAETVRYIYKLFLDGLGYHKIARTLNREGAKTPSTFQRELLGKNVPYNRTKPGKNGQWNERTVERILRDEAYIGTLVNHKSETNNIKKTFITTAEEDRIRHEGIFPPIVEEIVWKQVRAVLDARKQTKPRAGSNSKIHRYAGLLRCGDCDASFVAKRRQLQGVCYVEYVCSNYHRMGKDTCSSHRIKEEELDELLYAELRYLVRLADRNCEEVQNIVQTYLSNRNEAAIQAEHLRSKLAELQDEASKKVGYLATHPELEEMLMPDIHRTRDEIIAIKERIAKLDGAEVSYKSRLEDIRSSKEMLAEVVDARQITNASLLILVERIIISQNEDDTLNIKFKLRAPFQTHYILSRNIASMHDAENAGERAAVSDKLSEILKQIA